MADENLPAGQMYALRLVQMWLECVDVSQSARKLIIRGEVDNEITLDYITRLARIWEELYPKIRGRTDLKSTVGGENFVEKYEKFQVYYRDPGLLLKEPDQIIYMEEVIRQAMEYLKLTTFDYKV